MFCEDLTQEEVFEAYLLYTCLHGLRMDEATVREQVRNYYEGGQADERIDEALLAYLEDRILAPPDVVLDRWGSSRFYELFSTASGEYRRRTCEAWFLNGCRLPSVGEDSEFAPPEIVHFWTEAELEAARQDIVRECLKEGTRVSIMLREVATIVHRQHGELGVLPENLTRRLQDQGMAERKFLCLVDRDPIRTRDNKTYCSLLVVTGNANTPTEEIVGHAAIAFDASRIKC